MAMRRTVVVQSAAQMWPRLVFDSDSSPAVKGCLRHPGVYVLFRDDEPYCVGKTKNKLFRQIRAHAVRMRDRYYHFWNYFSAFVVPNARHRGEVEGVPQVAARKSEPKAKSAEAKAETVPALT